MAQAPIPVKLKFFVEHYGSAGATDQRAVETFLDCEPAESCRSLQNELRAVTLGKLEQRALDLTVGIKRRKLHGSYEEWARHMLLWISGYKG